MHLKIASEKILIALSEFNCWFSKLVQNDPIEK
jgi:hypothetical protein